MDSRGPCVCTWQNRTCAPTAHQRSVFAERALRNIGRADHSALMLAARITLAHFSVSSATSFPRQNHAVVCCEEPSARPALIGETTRMTEDNRQDAMAASLCDRWPSHESMVV